MPERALPRLRQERHYGDRTVTCFAERPTSLWQLVESAVARRAHCEAMVAGERRWTWHQLADAATRLARGLHGRGVGSGDRVLLLLGNRAGFVVASLALARLGAVAVPLSIRSAPPEVEYVTAHCGARLALVEDDLLGHVPAGVAGIAASTLDALDATAAAAPDLESLDEEDTAVILYTSGTTGRPKGAMLSHFNIVHSAMHFELAMALGPDDRSAVAVPLSHVTGLVAQLWTMVHVAGTLVLLSAFKAGDYLRLAERERITHTVLVPAMYQLCLLQEDVSRFDLAAWRVGGFGGAPMAPATIAALAEAVPSLGLVNCYGATETASPATIMPRGHTVRKPDSVGVAVACGELLVVDAQGRALPPDAPGEVWIRGPMVVGGYWADAAATALAFTDGWWHSGDLGRIDEAGYLHILDRIKDLINRGGYKVFTSEVEAVLLQHPQVIEAAVVGFPCPVLGERVRAFACVRGTVDAGELQAFCAGRLADYKVPERWTLGQDPLPRNANGKLLKKALRERRPEDPFP
jgi:acyl-CoA synthetase (AMP-forming)/AMP-acid ligase II